MSNTRITIVSYIRQVRYEIVNVSLLGGGLDLLAGDDTRAVAVGDILLDGQVEEHRLLAHDAELSAQPVQVELFDVLAVERDRAARRIVEALDELRDRRLAAARAAHKGHALAVLDVESQRLENLGVRPRRIGELDVFYGHVRLELFLVELVAHARLPVVNGRHALQQLEHRDHRRFGLAIVGHEASRLAYFVVVVVVVVANSNVKLNNKL